MNFFCIASVLNKRLRVYSHDFRFEIILIITHLHVVPEIREMRSSAESQLQCGVPNMEYVYKQDDPYSRRKRSAGWEETLPVSPDT